MHPVVALQQEQPIALKVTVEVLQSWVAIDLFSTK